MKYELVIVKKKDTVVKQQSAKTDESLEKNAAVIELKRKSSSGAELRQEKKRKIKIQFDTETKKYLRKKNKR